MKDKNMSGACYKCKHRRNLTHSAHSTCEMWGAQTEFDDWGIKKGWVSFPSNFDPVWLIKCDSFEKKEDK